MARDSSAATNAPSAAWIGDVAGAGGGLCFAGAAGVAQWPMLLSLAAGLTALVVAFAGGCLAIRTFEPGSNWRRDAISIGLRSAVALFFLGGGLIALIVWAYGAGWMARIGLLISLGLIAPAVLGAGYVGGTLATWVVKPRAERDSDATSPPPPRKGFLVWTVVASTLLYIGAVSLPTREKAVEIAPVIQPSVPPPESEPEPEPAAPSVPMFAYERPDGLETAEATSVEIVARVTIADFKSDSPVALSPSDRLLAYCKESTDALTVRDLHTDTDVAVFSEVLRPSTITWSSDSTRIACFQSESEADFFFVDLPVRNAMRIRVPEGTDVGASASRWTSPFQIALDLNPSEARVLELEFLRDASVQGDSTDWMTSQERVLPPFALTSLPQAEQFKVEVARVPSGFLRDGPEPLAVKYSHLCLGISNQWRTYRQLFTDVVIDSEAKLIPAEDLSKLVILGDECEVIYFGVRDAPRMPMVLRCDPPRFAEGLREETADLVAERGLCAYVCAGIVSPLNSQPVAPDRTRVKARAVCTDWRDDQMEFLVAEEYATVEVSDVVGDFFTIAPNGEPELIEPANAFPGAFTLVRSIAPAETLPDRDADSGVLSSTHIAFKQVVGGMKVDRLLVIPPRHSEGEDADAEVAIIGDRDSSSGSAGSTDAMEEIRRFVTEHHLKASSADIEGYVSDYIPGARYFDQVGATRDSIRKIQQDYYEKWSLVRESITTPIEVKKINSPRERYAVSYQIAFHLESDLEPGRIMTRDGSVDIEMEIVRTASGGLGIAMQSGEVSNVVSGKKWEN